MPYYHVYVEHHDPSRKGKEAYELDLSLEELVEHIANPYLNGETFMCGGQPVDAFFIDMIIVSKTVESSAELIPKLRAEKDRESAETGIGWGLSEEYLLIDYGENVTREFIKHPPRKKESVEKKKKGNEVPSKNVFIVHGHDDRSKLELARMLGKLSFNPIILSEQPDKGRTIIEKLEEETIDIGYAFVILTPDDIAISADELQKAKRTFMGSRGETLQFKINEDKISWKSRARQNVVLELGYFIGKIGRNRVCCLYRGDVKLPSDIHGVLFKKFDESVEECFKDIVEELKGAGYEIKL